VVTDTDTYLVIYTREASETTQKAIDQGMASQHKVCSQAGLIVVPF